MNEVRMLILGAVIGNAVFIVARLLIYALFKK